MWDKNLNRIKTQMKQTYVENLQALETRNTKNTALCKLNKDVLLLKL